MARRKYTREFKVSAVKLLNGQKKASGTFLPSCHPKIHRGQHKNVPDPFSSLPARYVP